MRLDGVGKIRVAAAGAAQEWADSRISDLIKKACESDKPFAEEVRNLREEVKRLRGDKEALEARCIEVGGWRFRFLAFHDGSALGPRRGG
jgi:hypothetical protein